MKRGKLGAFFAILNSSLVALLTSLDFENNYDYSTQATRPPFSQQLAVGAAHLMMPETFNQKNTRLALSFLIPFTTGA